MAAGGAPASGPVSGYPSVTVFAAVLDEHDHIDEVLTTLREQDYPGPLEVVIADGGSTDGTRERLRWWQQRWPALRVIDNPQRTQAYGLNAAAAAARGEVLVRADGHTVYAPDFVRRAVEALLTSDAVAVGGNLEPAGRTPFGRAVAAVLRSPVAVGTGAFHHARTPRPADTVYLGAFRRADFLDIGGYRPLPSGAAEDADLYFRWRRAGRTVLLDPAIRSEYRARDGVRSFWRQSLRYGLGKAEFFWLERTFPSWRPLAPLGLIVALTLGAARALAGRPRLLTIATSAWAGAVGTVVAGQDGDATHRARVALATVLMHLGYGLGLAWGLLRGPRPLRHLRS